LTRSCLNGNVQKGVSGQGRSHRGRRDAVPEIPAQRQTLLVDASYLKYFLMASRCSQLIEGLASSWQPLMQVRRRQQIYNK